MPEEVVGALDVHRMPDDALDVGAERGQVGVTVAEVDEHVDEARGAAAGTCRSTRPTASSPASLELDFEIPTTRMRCVNLSASASASCPGGIVPRLSVVWPTTIVEPMSRWNWSRAASLTATSSTRSGKATLDERARRSGGRSAA